MAYWLDEGWHCWPEVVRAGTAAAGLYARCGSYIAANTTDGLIPSEIARMYGTAEWAQRLVDVGLWTVEGDGFRDQRYFPLNPSRAKVEERRTQAAERQRRSREKRHGKPTRESRVTDTVTHGVTSRAPAPPPNGGGGARPRDAPGTARAPIRAVPPWCGRCHGETRRVVDEDGGWSDCPDCHPSSRRESA